MTYSEALNFILNKQSLGIQPGLSRILCLLDKMGNPQDDIKIIHIAGTNGKGTVANTICNALIKAGNRVGLFTSPWIFNYREQIQINNQYISENDFAEYIEKYQDNDCTEFEMLVAVMYKYFADQDVDYAVIECGMGGKGDATNVEKSNICSVITSVSLDHTDFLGNTVEKIKAEKLGIKRDNSPCFDYKNYSNSADFNENNLSLASAVINFLGYDNHIRLSKPPARQEMRNGILLDGGHNTSAAIGLQPVINNEIALIGMMRDKDVEGYLSLVAPKCKRIIATTPDNPRAMGAGELAIIAKKYCSDVVCVEQPEKALSEKGITLICGSFYLIRQIINLI